VVLPDAGSSEPGGTDINKVIVELGPPDPPPPAHPPSPSTAASNATAARLPTADALALKPGKPRQAPPVP
jgi:hypothetical protein